jgi:serine/threonine protein kinase
LKFPFEGGDNILELYQTIKEAKFEFPIEPNYSRKMKYVIKKCLDKNPKTRKTADEILKILIAQKREVLDKYKPIFIKKIFSVIDLPVDELALGLDFFAEKCNAVFENPKDKDKPFIVKFEKKLNEYNIPKERFSKEVYKKIFSMKKMVKPPTDIKKEKEKEKEKEVKTENKGRHFISILNAKVKEVTITTTTTTIETVETKIVKENGENEGKSALKKYIEEK